MVGLDLESIDDLDALGQMLKLTFSNDDWQPMIKIADKLYEETCVSYHFLEQDKEIPQTRRPLIYYFGYSQLCKGVALQKLRKYQEARECISRYSDLSWFKGVEDKDKYIIEDFRIFSIGNSYTLDLLEGKEDRLQGYVDYLKYNKHEVFAGLITIFEAALKYDFNIDWALAEMKDELDVLQDSDNLARIRYYTEFLYLYALYEYKQQNYTNAIHKNLEALTVSSILRDNTAFKKMVCLFESFRDYASEEQERNYKAQLKSIFEEMLTNEKEISYDFIHSSHTL
ncbi:DNA-binding protein [Paenibacillus tepidiphilus]|uniref:DNA-binding protein n=1 Tax=Paenibacillus tepidiphilus TaxID=2608683 RepID=UPI00123C53B9|nr:DNA-binding protein [Paenibacillus tepidiphilus]